MINKGLLDYIKSQESKGVSGEIIRNVLIKNGWDATDIEEAYKALETSGPQAQAQPQTVQPTMQPQQPKPVQTGPVSAPIIQPKPFQPAPSVTPATQPKPVQPITPPSTPPITPRVNPAPNMAQPQPKTGQPAVATASTPFSSFGAMEPKEVLKESMSSGIPASADGTRGVHDRQDLGLQSLKTTGIAAAWAQTGTEPKKKSKVWLWVTIIILIVLLGGGTAYAYFTGYFASLDTLPMKAINKAKSATSGGLDVTLSVDTSGVAANSKSAAASLPSDIFSKKMSLSVVGAYDVAASANPKFKANINLDLGTIKGVLDAILVDHNIYAKISKFPTLPFLGDLSQYEDKWYSVPTNGPETKSLSNLPVQSVTGVNPDSIAGLTDAQKNQIYQITENAHFITVTKHMLPQTVGGALSYHFSFVPDQAGIVAYMNSLKDYLKSTGMNDSSLSSLDTSNFSKDFAEVHNFQGEAWIGIGDGLPHKISISFDGDVSATPADGSIKINLVAIFSDWNKPADIKAPTDSVPFETLINNSLSSARAKAKDANIKETFNQMRNEAELFAEGSKGYNGFCSSNKGKDLLAQINNGSSGAQPVCNANKNNFAASATLSDGTYWCVDSSGFAAVINQPLTSTSTSCPAPSSTKTDDASIKSSLAGERQQSILYFRAHKTYIGFCASPVSQTLQKSLGSIPFACNEAPTLFATSARLTNGFWCIDSVNKYSGPSAGLPPSTTCIPK